MLIQKLPHLTNIVKFVFIHFVYYNNPYISRPYRLMVRTSPSHGGNPGSTPGRVTKRNFALRERTGPPEAGKGGGQKSASLRDKTVRSGHAEVRGFVTNMGVRSDFFDEGGNFREIVG